MDKEELEFYMEDLRKSKNRPQAMANEVFARELYEEVLREFPEAVFVEVEGAQWIAVTPAAKKQLRHKFVEQVARREQEIAQLRANIAKLF